MKEISKVSRLEEYQESLGIEPKEVKISKLEDVFKGEELERMMDILKANKEHRDSHPEEDGGCHYNSGMMMYETLQDWDITFCEGLIKVLGMFWISHCWTCLTNKETGEKKYIDMTLNESNQAILFAEWEWDIIDLFNATEMAIVPHLYVGEYVDDYAEYFANHYPKIKV